MLWRGRRQSANIEDRRGEGFGGGGMGRMRLPIGGRVGGIGGIGAIILLLLALLFGIDPMGILGGGGGSTVSVPSSGTSYPGPLSQQAAPGGIPTPTTTDEQRSFVAVVLADTEDTWRRLFEQSGRSYREPTMVLFSGATQSGCGFAQAQSGPFYCPADGKVYLDTSFFDELTRRFGAPGDFAQAYVIAHEVGHHVQNLLGILPRIEAAQRQLDRGDANRVQVMAELQADCFAGLWAHDADRSRKILERGDVEEALNAAAAIGDDRLQSKSRGYVVPDSFTHGSSAQRVAWFRRGFEQGSPDACDTFNAG